MKLGPDASGADYMTRREVDVDYGHLLARRRHIAMTATLVYGTGATNDYELALKAKQMCVSHLFGKRALSMRARSLSESHTVQILSDNIPHDIQFGEEERKELVLLVSRLPSYEQIFESVRHFMVSGDIAPCDMKIITRANNTNFHDIAEGKSMDEVFENKRIRDEELNAMKRFLLNFISSVLGVRSN